jgi:hypothetical protein
MSRRPQTALVGKDLQRRAFGRHPHYEIAHARGYDAESHVAAMDIEGIDVAVIYGTRGRQVLMHDELEPEVAAALARAHNNWTREFCAHDPGPPEIRRPDRVSRRRPGHSGSQARGARVGRGRGDR